MGQSKELFKTPYGSREKYWTPSGSRYQNTYGYQIDNYGQKKLVKTGETDLYAKIQESLEETKIENIIKRVVAGDESVLHANGIYADVTETPKNLIEARQQIQNLENTWEKLPIDIKRKYNMSVDDFIAKSGSESWLLDMGLLKKQIPAEEPIAETKGGEKE